MIPREHAKWKFFKSYSVPGLKRYELVRTPLFSVTIHRFIGESFDPLFHDHPADFFSVILKGWYQDYFRLDENSLPVFRSFTMFNLNKMTRYNQHKITSVSPGTWTLFVTGPYYRKRIRFWNNDGTMADMETVRRELSNYE